MEGKDKAILRILEGFAMDLEFWSVGVMEYRSIGERELCGKRSGCR